MSEDEGEGVSSVAAGFGLMPNAPTFHAGLKYLSEDEYAVVGCSLDSAPSLAPSIRADEVDPVGGLIGGGGGALLGPSRCTLGRSS